MSWSKRLRELEYALHPDREEVRTAMEDMEVDPSTDVIVLGEEEHREFPKGNLRQALTDLSWDLDTTVVVVRRNDKEIFKKREIKDLFGSVFF